MQETSAAVVRCYSLWDLQRLAGMIDLTEGIYPPLAKLSYEEAQRVQTDVLLNRVGCDRGSTILDIGCGYGRLVARARECGADAIGVTISPEQVRASRARGVPVELANYRNLLEMHPEWRGSFSGIVANGSAEHFVQPEEALAGQQDQIYSELFRICSELLKPGGRFATTIIHFLRAPQPEDILQGPWAHPWGSDSFHWSMLLKTGGAFYPSLGQLERCAAPYFSMELEEDYTEDYRRTSEEWKRRHLRALLRPAVQWGMVKNFVQGPRSFFDAFVCMVVSQSWLWQFQPPAPTKHLHHVWVKK